jgi:ribosomal protein S18 acetylase RimI-like enzyme
MTSSRLVPAPRSFGVGTDSSSSSMEEDEEEEVGEDVDEADKVALVSDSTKEKVTMHPVLSSIAEGHRLSLSRPTMSSQSAGGASSIVLAGPTHDVAPPRAIRVMGAPPLNGLPIESETILGVASARIKVVQRSEGDDIFGKSESLDSSWPGLDPKGEKSMVTREAHIITLSIIPGERGQGLGARLLDYLLEECKRRTAGPRIHLATGSNTLHEDTAEGTAAPRVHENAPMRTFLEVHPSNKSAVALYHSRNFRQVEGSKGVVKHYFRGDNRIPNFIRVQVGGSDAIRLERFDFSK